MRVLSLVLSVPKIRFCNNAELLGKLLGRGLAADLVEHLAQGAHRHHCQKEHRFDNRDIFSFQQVGWE
jgi:hypothetical protein